MSSRYHGKELGKIARFEYGKSPEAVRSLDGLVPVYGTGGLMGYANASLHSGPSVIVGRKGSLGNPIYSDGPFWAVDTTYYAAECDGSMRWLHYLLCSLRLENYNEATGVPSLARPTLNGIRVPHPTSEEQGAIVRTLATIDRAIERTEALLAKQQRIKTGLVHDLLTRGLDAQGHIRPISPERIPSNWTPGTLGQVATFNGGYAFKWHELTEFGKRVVRISNLHNPEFPYWHYSGPVRPEWVVRAGDLLFSWAGVATSIDVYLYQGEEALINQHIYNLVIPDNDLRLFTFHYMTWILPKLRQEIEGGVGQLHLTKAKIQAIPIPVPQDDELLQINSLIGELNKTECLGQTSLDKLRRLKSGLMHDLLTGDVPITQLLSQCAC